MNALRDNFGNSSNDTGPDSNLIGHIVTRDHVDELERLAINKANQAQASKEQKISPGRHGGGYSITNDFQGLVAGKGGRHSLSSPQNLL